MACHKLITRNWNNSGTVFNKYNKHQAPMCSIFPQWSGDSRSTIEAVVSRARWVMGKKGRPYTLWRARRVPNVDELGGGEIQH